MEITITKLLTEVMGEDEKYVVRMYDPTTNRELLTRVVSTLQDAENVRLEWQKRSS